MLSSAKVMISTALGWPDSNSSRRTASWLSINQGLTMCWNFDNDKIEDYYHRSSSLVGKRIDVYHLIAINLWLAVLVSTKCIAYLFHLFCCLSFMPS